MVSAPFLQLVCMGAGVEVQIDGGEVAALFDGECLAVVGSLEFVVVVVIRHIRHVVGDDHDCLFGGIGTVVAGELVNVIAREDFGRGNDGGDGVDVWGFELRVVDVEEGSEWEGR